MTEREPQAGEAQEEHALSAEAGKRIGVDTVEALVRAQLATALGGRVLQRSGLAEQDRRMKAQLNGAQWATHEDLARIHDKINGTAQAVSAMGGKLDAMNDNLRLILTRIADRGMQ